MSEDYSRDHIKISIAKILQTLGWHSINSTPLDVLTDLMCYFVKKTARISSGYASEFGQTNPNLDHLGLAFRDMGVDLQELEEYVTYVNFGPGPAPVPKYPLPKEDHLNFLKPGSKEVVTRPVHIHEHLPPMHPLLEGSEEPSSTTQPSIEPVEEQNTENAQFFKKPSDVTPAEFKRLSFRKDEESSRPTREISSVMMTTSGFLSPAREGKLPESRTPIPPVEPNPPPPPPIVPEVNKPVTTPTPPRKILKPVKKTEKKKEKVGKELFKPLSEDKKKSPTTKGVMKMKQKMNTNNLSNYNLPNGTDIKLCPPVPGPAKQTKENKANKALAAARLKTEKLNTTITPIPIKAPIETSPGGIDNVSKLFTEPDRKKVNILKKISNVKNEKPEGKIKKEDKIESRESSPGLIIDVPPSVEITNKLALPGDVTIEPINAKMYSPKTEPGYFEEYFPPGRPSTPKTPEIAQPILGKEKRKRKIKARKGSRHQSPHFDTDILDMNMDRPKTPEGFMAYPEFPGLGARGPRFPFPYPPTFAGPGLIPPYRAIQPGVFNFFNQRNPYVFNQLSVLPQNIPIPTFTPPLNNEPKPPKPRLKSPVPVAAPTVAPPPVQLPLPPTPTAVFPLDPSTPPKLDKKSKEHKKEKKDKLKKKNKKDKLKAKAEKQKLKEEKKAKDKLEKKKEKREKRKEKELQVQQQQLRVESPVPKLTLKLQSPVPEGHEMKKLNIKPIVRKDDESSLVCNSDEKKRETSPGLAKISALVTGPPKPKNATVSTTATDLPSMSYETPKKTKPIPKIRTKELRREPILEIPQPPQPVLPAVLTSKYIDEHGNEVWICPACGSQDDGSPMIGCDDCDAWYHWVCVGIQVPPDDNENWYCRHCLLKKNEEMQTDKKKKRKKREKKEH